RMGVGTEWCRASGAKEIRGRFGRKGKTGVDADPDRKKSIKTRSVYEIAAARQRAPARIGTGARVDPRRRRPCCQRAGCVAALRANAVKRYLRTALAKSK